MDSSGCIHRHSGGCLGSVLPCLNEVWADNMESQRLEPLEWFLRDLSGKTQWPKLPTDQALCLIMVASEKLDIVLVWISNAVRKRSIQKQLRRRGFISTHPSSSLIHHGGKPQWETKGRAKTWNHGEMLVTGSLSSFLTGSCSANFLIQPRATCRGGH